MKKIYCLSLLVACFGIKTKAQTAIPNAGFENWSSVSYEDPANYIETSNAQTLSDFTNNFNCVKVADPFHGNFAIRLTTIFSGTDTTMGFFVNSPNTNGSPNTWHGGVPYTQKPSGIYGHYKSAIPAGDSALILASFSLAGNNIGFYVFKLYGTHAAYTPFNFTFSPALAQNPDSVTFAATSSDVFDNIQKPGSMLQLDSIGFTGVASQPALLNGDFEQWQTTTINTLTNWYADYRNGVYKTTDAHNGSYALELKTTLGDRNGTPAANSGRAGTGYNSNHCNGMCTELGGYPFTNTSDTLAFWYKYAPTIASDSATVFLNFKKNGSDIWGSGKNLGASATYRYVEIPYNIMGGQHPDTVMVDFQSSIWQDSTANYVGADFKVDDVHFKSQAIGTGIAVLSIRHEGLKVYPNPVKDVLNISTDLPSTEMMSVKIMDITGKVIQCQDLNSVWSVKVNTSQFAPGIYFYELKHKDGTISKNKFVKQD